MTAIPKPLAEQVIVITSASSGVGLCTAQMAALMGARLAFVSRGTQALDGLVATINSSGGESLHVAADLCDRRQVAAAAQAVARRFGRIDTWINNAGISIYGRLDEVSEADSRRLFDLNFWGVVNGSLAALPHLVNTGGSLINLGSEAGRAPSPRQGFYASSKEAVKGFTDALRLEMQETAEAPVLITLLEPQEEGAAAIDPMRMAQAILAIAGGHSPLRGAAPSHRHASGSQPEREAGVHSSH